MSTGDDDQPKKDQHAEARESKKQEKTAVTDQQQDVPPVQPDGSDEQERKEFYDPDVDETVDAAIHLGRARVRAEKAAFGRGAMLADTIQLIQSAGQIKGRRGQLAGMSELERAYADTDADNELRDILLTRHVVGLTGKPGTGRFTTACRALIHHHGPDQITCIDLDFGVGPTEILDNPDLLISKHGHVLKLAGHALDPLKIKLRILEGLAKDRKARLVLVADGEPGERMASGLAVAHRPPDCVAVFCKWFSYQLAGRCVAGCALCTGACVEKLAQALVRREDARRELGLVFRPDHAVALAVRVARQVASGPDGPDLSALASLFSDSPARLRQRAERMLQPESGADPLPDQRIVRHQRAARISYTVFAGLPIAHVFEVTGWLMDEMDQEEQRTPLGRPVFDRWVAELLGDDLHADGQPDTPVRPGISRRVPTRHERMIGPILDVAWHDFDNARLPLLRWLDRMARDDHRAVRWCAGHVAGWLSEFDYDQVYERLLETWARAPTPRIRQTAAWALSTAADRGPLNEQVGRQVHGWAESPSAYLRDAAARVYLSGFGRNQLEYVLEDLRIVAMDPLQRWSRVIPVAITKLYQPERADTIVATMVDWFSDRNRLLRTQAARSLMLLLRQTATGTEDDRPELLAQLANGRITQSQLERLWTTALLRSPTSAWPAFEDWLKRANTTPEAMAAMATLTRGLVRHESVRTRLRFHVNSVWRPQLRESHLLRDLAELLERRQA